MTDRPDDPSDARTLRAVLDAAPFAVLLADDEGRYVDANPVACRVFGCSREQLVGRSVQDFVSPVGIVPARPMRAEFLQRSPQAGEFWLTRMDGARRLLRYHAVGNVLPGLHASYLEDVTDIHREQLARSRAEVERDRIFQLSDDLICIFDREGRLRRSNPAFERVLGFRESELIGESYADLTHPDDLSVARHAREMLHAQGAIAHLQLRFRHRDGSYRWIDWSASRYEGEDYAIGRDVTEERKLADKLDYERRLFEAVLRQMPDAVVVCRAPDGKLLLANEQMTQILRHPVVPAENVAEYARYGGVHADGRRYAAEEYPVARSLLRGEVIVEEELAYSFGDGSCGYISVSSSPIRNARGDIVASVATFRDATGRRQAKQALERSEEHFRALADNIPIIIWIGNADDTGQYFNRHWYDYTGMDPQAGAPSTASSIGLVHPDDAARVRTVMAESRAQGEDYEMTYRLRRKDGAYRWHLTRSASVRDAGGRIVRRLGYATDIEDQRRSIDALQFERDLRERFVAALSHDLRSPLYAVKLSAELLARQPAGEQSPGHVQRILRSVDHADLLLQNLLDASRISAGEQLAVQRTRCDVSALIRGIVQDRTALHGERFELGVPPGIFCSCDPAAIRRTLENLLSNAIKYGDPRGMVRIQLSERGDDCLALSVHNRGNPIPPEEQVRIFEPYHRGPGKDGAGASAKGWGLGLTLIRGTAEAHGGTVSVDSSPERGTTFTVTLSKV